MSATSHDPSETTPEGQQSFSWDTAKPLIPLQWPITIFRNAIGGVVIRSQEPNGFDGEDGVIVLSSDDHVRSLIKALQREIGDA